jgi:hypothetical protein
MTLPSPPARPVTLFYSYSHKDEKLREKLEEHLSLLNRQGLLSGWHDRCITASLDWAGQIDSHLNSADLILLLVSPAFLASNYCYDLEMTRAVQRGDEGSVRVVPVILRPCDWRSAPFGKFQGLPRDGKPVITWKIRDEAFLDVALGLRNLITSLIKNGNGVGVGTSPAGPAAGGPSTTTITPQSVPPPSVTWATTTTAPPSALRAEGHVKLTSSELEEVVTAAEACDLLRNRALLFRDMPPRVRNMLPQTDDPISQVRSDLHALNDMGRLKGSELPALALWLGTAETLADVRAESDVFQRMRARVTGGAAKT